MAFQKFIPSIWNKEVMEHFNRATVFANDCHTDFEGSISALGQDIIFTNVADPTIKRQSKAQFEAQGTGTPEKPQITTLKMTINQVASYSTEFPCIDTMLANIPVKENYQKGFGQGMANETDKYIGALANDGNAPLLHASAQKIVDGTASSGELNVLDCLDMARQKLQENDVPNNEEVIATVSPAFMRRLRKAYVNLSTNNPELIKRGIVGEYNGIYIKLSNNIYKNASNEEKMFVKTKKAVGYANPVTKSRAYVRDGFFDEVLNGFSWFDAKILMPKQMIVLHCKYS